MDGGIEDRGFLRFCFFFWSVLQNKEGKKSVKTYLWESKQRQSFCKPVSDVSHREIVDTF